ncbi:MAG TPA: sulfite exporter TauE/SafE family protein [Vicinamibacterales bacterium]|nr:sulfite exporter TauE/SafE family protein [Vicinamibacterales bacterium]
MWYELAVSAGALLAGMIAALAGFGIGSVLTPLLALRVDAKLAVAAVAIPHVAGTALRFWLLRSRLDRRIFVWFGATSAAGGLAGALLHAWASSRALAIVFGGLLLFVGCSELTGFMSRVRLGRRTAWFVGALSGLLGGMVGNQGGIRSAALLAFETDKRAFVATATAVGLIVDAARLPVYLAGEWPRLVSMAWLIGLATAGVLLGTVAGMRLLPRIPERVFRIVVALLLLALGAWMVLRPA